MSLSMIGVVEQVGGKDVNTKFGVKPTFSFKVNGQWFSAGFKDPKVAVGDSIGFEYEPDKYGNKLHDGSIKKGVSTPIPTVSAPSGGYVGRHGSFPIGPLDGQRSIIRQNAVTNARELYTNLIDPTVKVTVDQHTDTIINIARHFEAYTAGDLDMDAAMKED
jgi:hypothetical protein